jgi:hypothetical protein
MRLIGRKIAAALAAAILAAALAAAPAAAQGFNPNRLSEGDRAALVTALEYEQTNRLRRLPESGAGLTIVRTETRPRICRYFIIDGTGGRQNGVGCRRGPQQWDLAGTASAVPPAPTEPIIAAPAPVRDGDERTTVRIPVLDGERLATAPAPAATLPAPAAPPQVAAAARPDFPRPGRRPGTGIPLIAAPAAVRDIPAPPAPPADARGTDLATLPETLPGDPEADADAVAAALDTPEPSDRAEVLQDAAPAAAEAEEPRSPEEAEPEALARLDSPPDIPLPLRRPGSEAPGAAGPVASADSAESEGAGGAAGEVTDGGLTEADQAPAGLARLGEPPQDIPLPERRPGADAAPAAVPAETVAQTERASEPAPPAADDPARQEVLQEAGPQEQASPAGDSQIRLVDGEGVATLPLPRRRPHDADLSAVPEIPLPQDRPSPPS